MKVHEFGAKYTCPNHKLGLNLFGETGLPQQKKQIETDLIYRVLFDGMPIADIPAEMDARFPHDLFINEIERKKALEIESNRLVGYLTAVKEEIDAGVRTPIRTSGMDVKVFSRNVEDFKPDIAFKTPNGIEVIIFRFKKPDIAQNGSTYMGCVNLDLRIYSMWQYGAILSMSEDDTISAGYQFLGYTDDTKPWVLNPVDKKNVRFKGYSQFVKFPAGAEDFYTKAWEMYKSGVKCSDSECMFCPYVNSCKFEPVPAKAEKNTELKKLGAILLSPMQEQIINSKGICVCNSGAGAGKTTVGTLWTLARIANGAKPEEILMTTFTVNAAEEMRQRIKAYCEDFGFPKGTAERIWITTQHGLGQKAIEIKYADLGYTECPVPVDSITRKEMIRVAIEGVEIPGVNYSNFKAPFGNGGFDNICDAFDFLKLNGARWHNYEVLKADGKLNNSPLPVSKELIECYEKYLAALKNANLIEFADQELLLKQILDTDPYFIEENYGIKFILGDEFQDTDAFSLDVFRHIMEGEGFKDALFVGDDSQNIYEHLRNTTNDNILRFDELIGAEEGEVKHFDLVENYRSSGNIIDEANKINARRIFKEEKDLIAKREPGPAVEAYAYATARKETASVAEMIEKKIQAGEKPEDIAFIARDSADLKRMREELTKRGIASQFLTPEKMLQNSRVIGSISLVKAIADPDNTQAIFDYLNVASDGQLFKKSGEEIKGEIRAFQDELKAAKETGEPSSYSIYLDKSKVLSEDDEVYAAFKKRTDKFKTFGELLDYIRAFERFGEKESHRAIAYKKHGVVLTTVHSSKGLEWPTVFVSTSKLYKEDSSEESRRVLFVAVTRAKDELVCTSTDIKKGKSYIKEIMEDLGKEYTVIPDELEADKEEKKEIAKAAKESQQAIRDLLSGDGDSKKKDKKS